jgi:hypothetical protein
LLATTSLSTTVLISIRPLAREQARLLCTPQLEGKTYQIIGLEISVLIQLTSLIGIGEIVLLPLDVLKIKRQTNPEAFRGRGLFKIIADEGMGLYRGAGWTAARNAPGSFALFGGSAFAKEYIYNLSDYNAASWGQNFVASVCGASASLVVSAPLDVIKTRIQNRNFENPESGFKIVSKMLKHEGPTSFFKGLTPKLLMTGPKLVFSFWLAQTLIPAFGQVV